MPFAVGLVERECPRCHRAVELPLGDLCPVCRADIDRRARKLANRVALGTTALLAVYVLWRVPEHPVARLVSGMSVGIWFVLTNLVVRRAVRELTK